MTPEFVADIKDLIKDLRGVDGQEGTLRHLERALASAEDGLRRKKIEEEAKKAKKKTP